MDEHLAHGVEVARRVVQQREVEELPAVTPEHQVVEHLVGAPALGGGDGGHAALGRGLVVGRVAQTGRACGGWPAAARRSRPGGAARRGWRPAPRRAQPGHTLGEREPGDLLVGAVVCEGVRGGLEAHHQRRRLARHLGDEPRAAPVGGHAAVDRLAPEVRCEVGLQHLVRDGDTGAGGDLRHPGEFVVEVPHVAAPPRRRGARPCPAPRRSPPARRPRPSSRPPARRPWPGAGPSASSRRRSLPHARPRARWRPSRRSPPRRRVVPPALAEHVGAQGPVGHQARHVEHPRRPLHLVEVLPEGLPVPRHALGERRAGDVLHALHELDQPRAIGVPRRGEPHAAVAHDDGRHAVPTRRRDLGVPGGLAVVMGVDVDPTGRHQLPLGVDLAPGRAVDLAHGADDTAIDRDVADAGGPARTVGDRAAPDDQVVHRCALLVRFLGPASWVSRPHRPSWRGAAAYTQLRSFRSWRPDRRRRGSR